MLSLQFSNFCELVSVLLILGLPYSKSTDDAVESSKLALGKRRRLPHADVRITYLRRCISPVDELDYTYFVLLELSPISCRTATRYQNNRCHILLNRRI